MRWYQHERKLPTVVSPQALMEKWAFRVCGRLAGIFGDLFKHVDTSWEEAGKMTDGFIHDGLVLSLTRGLVEEKAAWCAELVAMPTAVCCLSLTFTLVSGKKTKAESQSLGRGDNTTRRNRTIRNKVWRVGRIPCVQIKTIPVCLTGPVICWCIITFVPHHYINIMLED